MHTPTPAGDRKGVQYQQCTSWPEQKANLILPVLSIAKTPRQSEFIFLRSTTVWPSNAAWPYSSVRPMDRWSSIQARREL